MLKDPYQFDSLTLQAAARERDIERTLIARVKGLLLKLGKGFSFIGSQHRLEIGNREFYVDLLFYQRRLRCLVAIDLKTDPFQPETACIAARSHHLRVETPHSHDQSGQETVLNRE